jgi:outer membrane immunogenic protein
MRRLSTRLIVAISTIALAQVATKGDLKAAPIYLPPPVTWTGYYVGGNLGIGWFDPSFAAGFTQLGIPPDTGLPPTLLPGSAGFSSGTNVGVVGGVHGGYNWQLNPQWVVGIEGDFDLTSLRASGSASNVFTQDTGGPVSTTSSSVSASADINWIASLRARGGYLWWPNLLLYGTAGVAWADVDYRADFSTTVSNSTAVVGATVPLTVAGAASFDAVKSGFVVGAGAEYMWSRQWLLRAEFLFYDFNATTHTFGSVIPATFHWDSFNVSVVRLGASYKF